ncbi:MAG: hypothetical protein M3Y88_02500 [Chloroflexota bacterium]|nr:hypothetical protein [Chloroflexota bacterium]
MLQRAFLVSEQLFISSGRIGISSGIRFRRPKLQLVADRKRRRNGHSVHVRPVRLLRGPARRLVISGGEGPVGRRFPHQQ